MSGKAAVLLLLGAVLVGPLCGGAWAQSQSGVVISSVPPGAIVELVGEHVFRGVTPWELDRGLSGVYEVHAYKAGYADWEGNALLSASRRDSIFIRMSRKTPMTAGLRSAILPGWGQFHTGQKGKGTLFFLAEAAAVAGVIWADGKRDDAERDYDAAQLAYMQADQIEEVEAAYLEMQNAYNQLSQRHDTHMRWVYAASAVWLANVLDATLLFPSVGAGSYAGLPAGDRSGLYASIEPDRTSAGVIIRF